MKIRKHYYVSGSVQGVGFRYWAYHLANSLGITGYVTNLYDGRVELELQGEKDFVNGFLDRIAQGSFIYIDDVEVSSMAVEEEERAFRIR